MNTNEVINDLSTLKSMLDKKVVLDLGMGIKKECFKLEQTQENSLLINRLSEHFFELENFHTRLFTLTIFDKKDKLIFIALTDILKNPIDDIIKALR